MKYLSLLLVTFALLSSPAQAQWGLFGPGKKAKLKCDNISDIKKGCLIAHIQTSTKSSNGSPITGNRPVQLGMAVMRKPAMIAAR